MTYKIKAWNLYFHSEKFHIYWTSFGHPKLYNNLTASQEISLAAFSNSPSILFIEINIH